MELSKMLSPPSHEYMLIEEKKLEKKNYYISSIKGYAREKRRCFFRAMALRCDPELAASAESGNLLKMHILKPHPRPTTKSETRGERPNYLILQGFLPGDSDAVKTESP